MTTTAYRQPTEATLQDIDRKVIATLREVTRDHQSEIDCNFDLRKLNDFDRFELMNRLFTNMVQEVFFSLNTVRDVSMCKATGGGSAEQALHDKRNFDALAIGPSLFPSLAGFDASVNVDEDGGMIISFGGPATIPVPKEYRHLFDHLGPNEPLTEPIDIEKATDTLTHLRKELDALAKGINVLYYSRLLHTERHYKDGLAGEMHKTIDERIREAKRKIGEVRRNLY